MNLGFPGAEGRRSVFLEPLSGLGIHIYIWKVASLLLFFHASSFTATTKLNMGLQQRQGHRFLAAGLKLACNGFCNFQGIRLVLVFLALVGPANGKNSEISSWPLEESLHLGESRFSLGEELSQDLGSPERPCGLEGTIHQRSAWPLTI